MPTFAYVARDASGRKVTGRLAGSSRQTVLAELESRRLAPVQVKPMRERPRFRRGVGLRQHAQSYRQLGDLLRAGVPLLRALRLLGRSKASARLGAVMAAVAEDVAGGDRLGDAMAARPEIFSPIQVAMVRAGERGGFLEEVLARMGTFLEHQADLRGRVIGNLIYPCVLLLVGLSIVVGALVGFVPKFRQFYARIDVPLPTQILLGGADFVTAWWPGMLAGAAAAVALVLWGRRQSAIRRRVMIAQMRIPKLGPLVRSLAVARFARILGTMLANGIPLLAAMQVSRDAAGNILLEEAIDEATEAVRAGETLAAPLGASGLFGEDIVEMISVGESANNLADVLVTIADTVEGRIDRMLAIFLRLMEPALLLGLAAIVLFIFVALIVPMMNLSSAM